MIQRMHASNRPDRSRQGSARRAFTLIELLVVMAIIAILMSLISAGVMAVDGRSEPATPPKPRSRRCTRS